MWPPPLPVLAGRSAPFTVLSSVHGESPAWLPEDTPGSSRPEPDTEATCHHVAGPALLKGLCCPAGLAMSRSLCLTWLTRPVSWDVSGEVLVGTDPGTVGSTHVVPIKTVEVLVRLDRD